VAKVLIDFGLPPIKDIPRLPQMARDALLVVALVMEHLPVGLSPSSLLSLFFVSPLEMTVKTYVCVCIYIYLLEWSRELMLLCP
jgi:hypothetical protein